MNRIKTNMRCYLCNCAFVDKKVYERMFEERVNVNGKREKTLASILALVLGYQLYEEDVYSTLVCSTCKVHLLNFEELESKLYAARAEIMDLQRKTAKLYDTRNIYESSDESDDADSKPSDPLMTAEPDCNDDDLDKLLQIKDEYDDSDNEDKDNTPLQVFKLPTNPDLPYECSECEESFRLKGALNAHIKATHKQPPKHICNTCEETFHTRQLLAEHRRTHKQDKQFTCEYCSKMFTTISVLNNHIRTHTGEKPFKCDICLACFSQRSNWRTHLQTTHLQVAKFECKECGKCFKRRRLLEYHQKAHANVRDIKCDYCNAAFTNPIYYKKHLRTHTGEKPYGCDICGKHFSRRENRNVHSFVHSNQRPYVCEVCGEGFMRKSQLVQHSKVTQHVNETIVMNKPHFNAANSEKLAGKQQEPPDSFA